jgi:hypothetical protein
MNKNLSAVLAMILCLSSAGGAAAEGWRAENIFPPEYFAGPQQTQDVVFGPSQTYSHKSGWFSLSVPSNWKVTDKSSEGEVVVSMADPTENGIVVVRIYRPGRVYTQAELGEILKGFIKERMGTFDGFTLGELKSQRDGSSGLYFKYDSEIEGVKYKMFGDTFIEQHNGLVGILTLIMPQDQYDAKQKAAYQLMNSFRVTGGAR